MSIIYTAFKCLRTAPLVIVAGVLILSSPALAAEDVFTVSGVKVDVHAENAVAAREKAFTDAQTVAFNALASRLLGEDEAKTYVAPDNAAISSMIKDFEITNERISAVEYIGTYTFRFDGPAVRRQFNMQGMKYSDLASKPVLVLPFFQVGSKITLWSDANPWLKAWGRNTSKGGLVPTVVPLGDAQDVGAIADDEALTYQSDRLGEMLDRYNTGDAVVLIAKPGPVDAGNVPVDLNIMIYRTDSGSPEYVQTIKVVPSPGNMADALYDKAVQQVRSVLQKGWKQKTMVDPVIGKSSITAYVQFTTMQEWVMTRQALQTVQGISNMKVKSVTPHEAEIELQFSGDVNRLRLALAQSDLLLSSPQTSLVGDGSGLSGYSLVLKKPSLSPY